MALRLAHIYLPKDTSGFLDDLRDNFNIIEHYEIEEKNRKEIKLLLDSEMAEPVLDFIENRYSLQENFRVIVTPVEAVIPRLEVEEKPEIDEENQKSERDAKRIYREELYEDINSVSSVGRTFILLAILSAFAVAIAIALGWFATVDVTNPEIAPRLQVSYADFVLALASGAAGALSFTSEVPGSLIGVMVAVALLPPIHIKIGGLVICYLS